MKEGVSFVYKGSNASKFDDLLEEVEELHGNSGRNGNHRPLYWNQPKLSKNLQTMP